MDGFNCVAICSKPQASCTLPTMGLPRKWTAGVPTGVGRSANPAPVQAEHELAADASQSFLCLGVSASQTLWLFGRHPAAHLADVGFMSEIWA